MTRQRLAVPKAYHEELTEYSSLLRTLRTNSILDISLHLTQHRGEDNNLRSDVDEEVTPLDDLLPSSVPPAVADPVPAQQGATPEVDSDADRTSRKRKRRSSRGDLWTRWPVLLTDLQKPAWSFDEEVYSLASQALKLFPPAHLPPLAHSDPAPSSPQSEQPELRSQEDSEAEEEDIDMEDLDNPPYYKFVVASASTYLENMLALIASHVPKRSRSMRARRLEPLDWRGVLEIASVYGDHGSVDEQIINNVRTRMETLYELPQNSSFPVTEDGENLVTYRLAKTNEAKEQLEKVMSQAYEGLFTLLPLDFLTNDQNTARQPRAIKASKEVGERTKKSGVTRKRRSTRLRKTTTKSDVSRKRKGTKKRKKLQPIISVLTKEGPDKSLANAVGESQALVEGPDQAVGSSSAVNVVACTGYDPAAEEENPENGGADKAFQSLNLNVPSSFKPGDLDQRPGGTRKMPSRRTRLNVSYTVPSYFFDETVMGK